MFQKTNLIVSIYWKGRITAILLPAFGSLYFLIINENFLLFPTEYSEQFPSCESYLSVEWGASYCQAVTRTGTVRRRTTVTDWTSGGTDRLGWNCLWWWWLVNGQMVKVKTEGLSFVMNTDNHYLGVCGISCCEFNTDFLSAGLVEHRLQGGLKP